MEKRIRLLDILVDTASTKAACEATIEYLNEESSKVVYFVKSESLLLLQQNNEWKDIVEESGLILPGTVMVSTSMDEVLGEKRDPFFVESYFDAILDYAIENGCEFLLIAEDEGKYISIQENIHAKRPYLNLSGMFLTEKQETLDQIVNEINSVAPDILLIALDEKRQLELLQKFRNQMNAGLMIFTGDVLYNTAVLEAEVPKSIQRLRLDNLYKWFRKGGRKKLLFNNLKMKLQVKRHHKEK